MRFWDEDCKRLIRIGPLRMVLAVCLALLATSVQSASVDSHFERIKDDPVRLREFLLDFPKGGELHTHLDGAVYAESYIKWAAEDGRCLDLHTDTILFPPCDPDSGRPRLSDISTQPGTVNRLIDAFSIRNYERRAVSGHDQFFSTFDKFSLGGRGRQGDMLAEVTARAVRQNNYYLELMDSQGMRWIRTLVDESDLFDGGLSVAELATSDEVNAVVSKTIEFNDAADKRHRQLLDCDGESPSPACQVEYRYLAQVIRVFPRDYILAQTLLAFLLMERDSRYVGLNFVAPEDAPITLRDYSEQMEVIREVASNFPDSPGKIALHAGELASPLVPPEAMRDHIYQAVHTAGASRVGHGVDIIEEDGATELLAHMAAEGILVEINLTSNAIILGVEGDRHPFALYRAHGVPLALSTDDEGVARIDLTHEYVRATQTYDLSYAYLKELSRNALAYSFLLGQSLFADLPSGEKIMPCRRARADRPLSEECSEFLRRSEKARMQWQLEQRFEEFENSDFRR